MKIQIVLFEGFGELVALAPYEVLKRGIEAGAPFEIELVTSRSQKEVVASFGVKVTVHDFLRLDNRPDLLIIPGGGWNHKAQHGARQEAEKGELTQIISAMHDEGTIVCGVCTGGMLMAASGILKDKRVAMHYLAKDELPRYGADYLGYRIVDEGSVITTRGVTSGIDLGLWIIERFSGAEIAAAVEHRMEYERRGVIWRKLAN
ncbi:DJ-1/PfpI family protein [Heyndrickxia sporothermodurans]